MSEEAPAERTAGGDANCVGVATGHPTHIPVRDSKSPTAGTLLFPPTAWHTFLTALRWPKSPIHRRATTTYQGPVDGKASQSSAACLPLAESQVNPAHPVDRVLRCPS
ncbi:DUF397 domain-containing protein [Streptomyces sp. RKND-216]|uniref:DUF397 domain-containing protein n=1 Tax=Streptomyces sp. RKND-216 TaxID=2562581 RepID=UPI00109D9646|nr:DUF397 domain-containing protein [Streptomyces sp. RKND-216]